MNRTDITNEVKTIFADVLNNHTQEYHEENNLFDYGICSLEAIMIVRRIESKLSVKLSARDFFEDPTLRGIVNKIFERKMTS